MLSDKPAISHLSSPFYRLARDAEYISGFFYFFSVVFLRSFEDGRQRHANLLKRKLK